MYSDIAGVNGENNDKNNNTIYSEVIPIEHTYQDIYDNNFDQDVYSEFTEDGEDDSDDMHREEINAQYDTKVPPQDRQIIDLTHLSDDDEEEELTISQHVKHENPPSNIEEQMTAMEEMLDNEIRDISGTVNENHNIEVEEGEELIEEPDTKILSEEMKTINDTYTTRYGRESRTESTYVPEIGGKNMLTTMHNLQHVLYNS